MTKDYQYEDSDLVKGGQSKSGEDLVRARARTIVLTRLLIAASAFAGIFAITALVVLVILIRDTQTNNAPIIAATNKAASSGAEAARSSKDSVHLLEDCLLPGGECFARQEEETGDILNVVSANTAQVVVAAMVCDQRGNTDSQDLLQCVNREVRRTRAAAE